MTKPQTPTLPPIWLKPAQSAEDFAQVLELRKSIYRRAGKVAEEGAYRNALDAVGEAFLIGRGSKAIGTFSLCDLSRSEGGRAIVSGHWEMAPAQLKSSLYIYFLGVDASERSASVLKFVFAEIFKCLVRRRLESIYVLADARLTRRYRWIGLLPVGQKLLSVFPKSGVLSLLHTRQIRAGVYGLHADPIRWNWYLRSATAELLREGALPRPGLSRVIFYAFSLFAPVAALGEALVAALFLRRKDPTPRRLADVRPL